MRLQTVVFICGAAVMSLEMAGSRLIAPAYGNSLYAWGSLIGVILGALSIGYHLGGKRADKNPRFHDLALIIMAAGLFVSFIPMLSGFLLQQELVYFMGMKYGPLISVGVIFIIPSILLGMVSPYAVRLEAKNIVSVGNTAGDLYAISTLGSIFGTFLTVFVLVPWMGLRAILFSLGVVLLITALLCAGRKLLSGMVIASMVFCTVFIVTPPLTYADGTIYRTILEKDTAYYKMIVVDSMNYPVRYMFLDGSATGAAFLNSTEAVYKYTDYFHISVALNPAARNVLFIGGGAGTGPTRFYDEYPDFLIDVVDIDPEVNQAAKKYFNLKEDSRLHIYNGDGRYFLSRRAGKYDIIIVDAFSSKSSMPFHMLTKEFMTTAKEHLRDGGYLVYNVHGSLKGPKTSLSASVKSTASKVFANVYSFHVKDNPYELQNIIILASNTPERLSCGEIIQRSQQLASVGGVKNLGFYASHCIEEKSGESAIILTDDYAPVDNLLLNLYDH